MVTEGRRFVQRLADGTRSDFSFFFYLEAYSAVSLYALIAIIILDFCLVFAMRLGKFRLRYLVHYAVFFVLARGFVEVAM